jgi:DNA-binding transcriptional regulator YdaS (Cro superfamily)
MLDPIPDISARRPIATAKTAMPRHVSLGIDRATRGSTYGMAAAPAMRPTKVPSVEKNPARMPAAKDADQEDGEDDVNGQQHALYSFPSR